MPVLHKSFQLPAHSRGFHLITADVLRAIGPLSGDGIISVFIQHTSAGLTINEAADPDVLTDFETYFNSIVEEELPGLRHTIEGPDDMPAHVKSTFTGHQVTIPFSEGRLMLGTWQGIYLCEFRNSAPPRRFIVTIVT